LVKRELQSRIAKHGKIFKLKSDGMGSGGEGKLRILHHADRGKVNDYVQEAIKNFLACNQDVITR